MTYQNNDSEVYFVMLMFETDLKVCFWLVD